MATTLITEDELQRALADPERRRSAFTTVVRLYSEQIYWQIRRMVYSHDDADDLVQNVFIKAWEAIDGFRGEAKVSTWLYRIALYEALNFLKKRRHEEEHTLTPSDEGDSLYLLERLTADEYFDADAAEEKLQRAILSLPPKEQLVFRLRYYDEMPYDQMAALTGTSEGALKASYHHAVKKVTEELQRSEYTFSPTSCHTREAHLGLHHHG